MFSNFLACSSNFWPVMNGEGRSRVSQKGKSVRNGFKFLRFRLECCFMYGVAVNEDRLVWSCGACIFTGAASDANIILHFRNKEVSFKGNHVTRFCRAVFRTGAASRLFVINDAVILYEDSLARSVSVAWLPSSAALWHPWGIHRCSGCSHSCRIRGGNPSWAA